MCPNCGYTKVGLPARREPRKESLADGFFDLLATMLSSRHGLGVIVTLGITILYAVLKQISG